MAEPSSRLGRQQEPEESPQPWYGNRLGIMTRPQSSVHLRKWIIQSAVCAMLVSLSAALAAAAPLSVPAEFQSALQNIRNSKFGPALEISRKLRAEYPQHPMTFLVTVEIYWKMIYFETGRIDSREVRNVADSKTSSYDEEFFQDADTALGLSEAMRKQPETAAIGAFYSGLAHGAKGRLYALRARRRRSISEAKRMRADLLEAIEKDPDLAPDAYLGLGAYNYYTDALSAIIKVIRTILGIPGGDRVEGLEQLRIASQKAVLWSDEAKYELAHIYAVMEGRPAMALPLFRELAESYPGNPLFALLAGLQAEKIGQRNTAVEYYRKSEHAAEASDADFRKRLVDAAKEALQRVQSGEPIRSQD